MANATSLAKTITPEEKIKVAYALNLCAVSVSQIIGKGVGDADMFVLKQERESILNNLNLQSFVKHPALFDVLKRILDTVTYLEIQAGDLSFIEREYQQKLKNAIWAAVPNPSMLFVGGVGVDPVSAVVSAAIGIVTQIGIGYMNYRRNKSEYKLDKEKSEWELHRHEIEQLQGLRAQLFETAWKLSSDYDFDDRYRLTDRQLIRYSDALLEQDDLKRFERLDVMSERFAAFPPFWYYKGNAAMKVYRDENKKYKKIAAGYKNKAIEAYSEHYKRNIEFLREDVVAASCCLEHISLLEPNDLNVEALLKQSLKYAGDNYDVLQQSVLVNIRLGKTDDVVKALREMIANDYNVGLNARILGRIYINTGNQKGYDTLRLVAGSDNIGEYYDNADKADKKFLDDKTGQFIETVKATLTKVSSLAGLNKIDANIYHNFKAVFIYLKKYCTKNIELVRLLDDLLDVIKTAVGSGNIDKCKVIQSLSKKIVSELERTQFPLEFSEAIADLSDKFRNAIKSN